jgi:transposase-like protein
VPKPVKVNEGSSVKESDTLPIIKLKGKQDLVVFEEARNATEPDDIERQLPVYTDDKL